MSGGLARLVLRAQGRLPVAAPLLPSRFAPTTPVAGATDWAGMDADDEAPATTSTQRTAPPPPRRPDPPQRTGAESTESAIGPHVATEPERDAPAATRDDPTVPSGVIAPAPPAVPPETVEPSQATPSDTLRPSSAPAPEAPIPLPMQRQIRPPAVPRASPLAARIAAPAQALEPRHLPDVHISIGRLEVHALPARATPARATPARAPRVTLADYLAQRK
jgi:hypothetical protein